MVFSSLKTVCKFVVIDRFDSRPVNNFGQVIHTYVLLSPNSLGEGKGKRGFV